MLISFNIYKYTVFIYSLVSLSVFLSIFVLNFYFFFSPGHLSVMLAIGNSLANSVWEARTHTYTKPTATSSREEKEKWIRAKYETKEFLPAISHGVPLGQQLVDAVCRNDMKTIIVLLAHSDPETVNSTVSSRDLRTPLHLACAMGNLAVAQLLIWVSLFLLYACCMISSCFCYFFF